MTINEVTSVQLVQKRKKMNNCQLNLQKKGIAYNEKRLSLLNGYNYSVAGVKLKT